MIDVAIIGCGPVGAMAANLLGRLGLSVVVLEKEADHYPLPRAVHLDHEMMRLFQSAGVIERVAPDMIATDGHLHVGADHGVIRYMGTVGKPKPFGWGNDYFFYQPEFEAHLRAAFSENGAIKLLTGAEFSELEQHDSHVRVRYFLNDTKMHLNRPEQHLDARWVIAADGSRSPVRKALGVKLDDLDFEEPWLVVDAEVEGPVTFPPITGVPEGADLQRLSVMMCDPARPATVVPGRRNHRRWEFMLLPGEDDTEMMRSENVAALVGAWMKDTSHTIVRAVTYRFHGLVAEQWQVGRVFLAGDAAHQTPPFFGQGMCHGLRDVANLAWKMAAIVKGGADEAILDTYQPERDPHVRAVIGAAVAAGRYICELDPAKAAARDAAIRAQSAQKAGETAADLIPAIATGFILPGSPAAGTRFIQPGLDDGRKLDDLTGQGWRLFVRSAGADGGPDGGIVAEDLPDGGAVAAWLDAHGAQAVLVRPDHYVFGSGKAADLLAARDRMLGLRQELAA
ncbi:MAG: monooxygenase [Novosphingobium sp. 28-62-57]|uniref:bifunctional 3-(3-hydroxy-phenyl)propionate/3-hydroxycinnamic acid hydroxylase n=1 Tax=unclassified Novosphingobium TaxID=2644732 RepID=UPI000BC88478|nr:MULTISPECIES: bifunctional 3-(3-hydroxy-phenyl)propionate/3-hydroxycinnamic acid hydroxylase [unclassified Novosphingobium]OYW50393.1 MAG: monooxygenase [Novosphingobium sp. 12-62-10]OYZ11502.1 MAG: monooxygenase [Novosphingobium sp. 28-62-57]OZA36215.1 MAG: monooxygenase [Novosphingobium sp. 17-62-9]HQS68579.1 bifunctional 3-(3-hydroxy-phenyl)propionate/3-hydroxycinnamic acid hydroxylase [Novosphingobium sp.]